MNGIAHVSGAFRATKHAPGCPKTPTSDETRHPWATTAKSVSVGVKLVSCGAHMCPFQARPKKSEKKCPWGAKLYLAPATFHSLYWRANDALGLGLRVDGRKSAKKSAVAKW